MQRVQNMMISNEMIDHQKDGFIYKLEGVFKNIEALCTDINKIDQNKVKKEADNLIKLIKDRLGLSVQFHIDKGMEIDAWCYAPRFDALHSLDLNRNYSPAEIFKYRLSNKKEVAQALNIATGKYGDPTGQLDYKNAKASGLFSKLVFEVHFTWGMILTDRVTAFHKASILLHELGHLWTFLQYLGTVFYKNTIISNSIKEMLDTKAGTERFKFLLDTDNAWDFKLDEKMMKSLSEAKDDDATKIMLGLVQRRTYNDVGDVAYDYNSSEVLADQFSARFGGTIPPLLIDYGTHRKDAFEYMKSQVSYIAGMSLMTMVSLVCTVFFPPAAIVSLLGFLSAVITWSGLGNIARQMSALNGDTYDMSLDRAKRIRNEFVTRIKRIKDPKIQKDCIAQLKELDELMAKYPEPKDSFGEKIIMFFNKDYKNDKEKMQLQQTIEELLANDLYVTAAQFKL